MHICWYYVCTYICTNCVYTYVHTFCVNSVDGNNQKSLHNRHFSSYNIFEPATILLWQETIDCRFAYIEFVEKDGVENSLKLHESLFKGRQLKVLPVLYTYVVAHELVESYVCNAFIVVVVALKSMHTQQRKMSPMSPWLTIAWYGPCLHPLPTCCTMCNVYCSRGEQ